MGLRGVLAGAAMALLVLLGAAAAAADTTTTETTTVPSTTTDPVTTDASTTTTTTAPATTTTAPPTTSTTSTTRTTTTPVTTTRPARKTTTVHARSTTTHAKRAAKHPARVQRRRPPACRVQAAVLLIPGRRPRVLTVAHGAQVSVARARCAAAHARLGTVSLLGRAVRARRVAFAAGKASTTGLIVAGRHVAPAGTRIRLRRWGYVVAARHSPVRVPGGRKAVAGLVVHLVRRHGGLPAGATLAIAVSGLRLSLPVPRRHRPPGHRPLRATPPLGGRHYVFPVAGGADYSDTYGGFRGDVPGNWHHGDDLFAPLGTPVVALAAGKIYNVGWEHLGGWRLWLRDRAGNEYYYAHLSGYALRRLHAQQVRAGQVLGFIGNTGDAITTPPHLHFEIHPRKFLRLGYDGAVNPTTYLAGWSTVRHVHAGKPVHPALPDDPVIRLEARMVFRRLLAARGLLPHPKAPPMFVHARSVPHRAAPHRAIRPPAAAEGAALAVPLVSGLASLALFVALLAVPAVRRRILSALR